MAADSKKVIWKNVQALMQRKFGKENVNGFASFVGIGVGSVLRMREQETSVGVDILDKIAKKFSIAPWQLLVADLAEALPLPDSKGMYYTPAPIIEALSVREDRRLTDQDRQLIEDLDALLPEERARYRKEVAERAALMRKHAEYLSGAVRSSRTEENSDEAVEQDEQSPAPPPSVAKRKASADPNDLSESLVAAPSPRNTTRKEK